MEAYKKGSEISKNHFFVKIILFGSPMADLTRICTNIKDLSKMVNFYIVNLKKNLTNPQETVVQWFESYKAFISYNKRSMTKMDISVKRALLTNVWIQSLSLPSEPTKTSLLQLE